MMTPQLASIRLTWRKLNHADGVIPARANRQSAIGDLAGKVLPCGKSFDDVERFGKTGMECVLICCFFAAYNPDSST